MEDRIYALRFIDFPTTFVRGSSMRELTENAREALSLNIRHRLNNNMEIPFPTDYSDNSVLWVEPSSEVHIPLLIKFYRQANGQTQREIADKIQVPCQDYQKLEQVEGFNPNLETLKKLADVFNKELYIEFR
jgi:DNA-binding XRE family transcriptional regulator/predicted RNase H-like HicB family nuclease